jgi:hypothetical protein
VEVPQEVADDAGRAPGGDLGVEDLARRFEAAAHLAGDPAHIADEEWLAHSPHWSIRTWSPFHSSPGIGSFPA